MFLCVVLINSDAQDKFLETERPLIHSVQCRPTKSSTFGSYFDSNFLSRFDFPYTLQAIINCVVFRRPTNYF